MRLASKLISIFRKNETKIPLSELAEEVNSNRIEFLVNELIKELKKDGKSIASSDISDDFGAFTVYVHNLGTEDEEIKLSTISWEMRFKPTFKEF